MPPISMRFRVVDGGVAALWGNRCRLLPLPATVNASPRMNKVRLVEDVIDGVFAGIVDLCSFLAEAL